jgi:threonine/homoserine/homoserine lactone efflux protein
MNTPLLLQGIILGFSIAAPVGPIGVLCIRRTLAQGRAYGFVSGLGAATADAAYGSVAAFGLAAVAAPLLAYGAWIRLVGGLLLLYLGARTVGRAPAAEAAGARGRGLLAAMPPRCC